MSLPRFREIEQVLRQRIIDNLWTPGVKLPSEAELTAEFAVSRITVRQALAGLHAQGLIEKVNGKGSFVTRPPVNVDLGRLAGFYESGRARGKVAHGKLTSTRLIAPPGYVREALGLAEDEKVLCFTTVRLWDETPMAVYRVMGREPLMRRLEQEDLETNDVMSLLEARLGYRLARSENEASAVSASAELARRLDVPEGAPLLRIRAVPHDIKGEALCFGELIYAAHRYSYKWTTRR
jgi:GntR family transcriptional regulator